MPLQGVSGGVEANTAGEASGDATGVRSASEKSGAFGLCGAELGVEPPGIVANRIEGVFGALVPTEGTTEELAKAALLP